MSNRPKKSSMKKETDVKPPSVKYRSVRTGHVSTNPMEEPMLGGNKFDIDFRPIPGPRFELQSRMQEFNENNEPSKIKKIGDGNLAVPIQRLVGYTPEGAPIYAATPKAMKKRGSTKHPKSDPTLKRKTYVHVRLNHTTKNPMEEAVYGDNNGGYVAVYHRANKPPINNNNKPSGGKASGAPGRRGILKSGTKKKIERVALDPQTTTSEFNANNAPEKVGRRDMHKNIINRTKFGPKDKPKRSRKAGRKL